MYVKPTEIKAKLAIKSPIQLKPNTVFATLKSIINPTMKQAIKHPLVNVSFRTDFLIKT